MDELIVEVLAGRADAETVQEIERWRAASPANERRFQDVARVWSKTEALAEGARRAPAPTLEGLLKRAGPRVIPLGVTPVSGPAPRRRLIRAAAAAAVFVGGLALGNWVAGVPAPSPVAMETVVTGVGELATVRLGDGSVVRLAPNSRLRIGSWGADREVWLDGRAFLSVSEDPDRPFRVRTTAGDARVLGTRFELEVRERVLQVVVVEGTVSLESGAEPLSVGANEVGRLADGVSEVQPADDVLRRVAWVGDFFAFERTPLSQVALEVSARFGVRVEILDSALASRTITGWYSSTGFRQTMEAVCLVVGAYCTITDSVTTIGP